MSINYRVSVHINQPDRPAREKRALDGRAVLIYLAISPVRGGGAAGLAEMGVEGVDLNPDGLTRDSNRPRR